MVKKLKYRGNNNTRKKNRSEGGSDRSGKPSRSVVLDSHSSPQTLPNRTNSGYDLSTKSIYNHTKKKQLVSRGGNAYDNKMIELIKQNNIEEIKNAIVKNGPEITNLTNTPLIMACKYRMENVALEILNIGKENPGKVNLAAKDRDLNTVLMIACQNNMEKVALELIETGQSTPEQTNGNEATALMIACQSNMEKVALEIVKTGHSKPESVNKITGMTALMIACKNKMEMVALEIVKTGHSNPGAIEILFDKDTALIMACQNQLEMVALEILKTGHSNPGVINKKYFSALSFACKNNMEIKTKIMESINEKLSDFKINCENMDHSVEKVELVKETDTHLNSNNRYIIHYEKYKNIDYPVITILKGTIMFTCRNIIKEDQKPVSKFYYLNKLDKDYTKTTFEDSRTFFYPIAYYALIISMYNTIDMVVLTEDIKLLCMISPSPLSRGMRFLKKNGISNCIKKQYDLCISMDVMKGLNIQGYIGIANMDSLNIRFNTINHFLTNYENGLFSVVDNIYSKSCVDKIIALKEYETDNIKTTPIVGIPEIVVIPFLFNQYTEADFNNQRIVFDKNKNLDEDATQQLINDNKRFYSFYTIYSISSDVDLIDACNKLSLKMSKYPQNYGQSLQSPMFTIYLPEFGSTSTIHPAILNKTLTISEFTLNMVDYKKSYKMPESAIESNSYSAFETYLYHVLLDKKSGGRDVKRLTGLDVMIKKNISVNKKDKYKMNSDSDGFARHSTELVVPKSQTLSKKIVEENLYFSKMVNNIPFLIIDTSKFESNSKTNSKKIYSEKKTKNKNGTF